MNHQKLAAFLRQQRLTAAEVSRRTGGLLSEALLSQVLSGKAPITFRTAVYLADATQEHWSKFYTQPKKGE